MTNISNYTQRIFKSFNSHFFLKVVLALFLFSPSFIWAESNVSAHNLGAILPAWSILPFIGMLLSIALLPLLTPHLWHRHYPKITAAWSLSLLLPFIHGYGTEAWHELFHMILLDYIPFIILLATLFTIGGGIYIHGSFHGSPKVNTLFLAIGTLLASLIGTTGASMLLIRPLLRANHARSYKTHTIIFFIFLVANIGGCLTPLGDPPLFLGFLHGVPFFWTLNLWKEMFFVAGLLLIAFFFLDCFHWKKEDAEMKKMINTVSVPLRIEGLRTLLFLMGVLLAIILSGKFHLGEIHFFGVSQSIENLLRDGFLLMMLAASWFTTESKIHEENHFSWDPIREVAILFSGIFITMLPALAILKAGEDGALAFAIQYVKNPAHFFWSTGILSSFLDNAPTYLTFLSTALGKLYSGIPERTAILKLIQENHAFLQAIAIGSVFMGANTYIGNAPNFMVKSIAEKSNIKMPSFFGYIFRYSLIFLIPIFLLVTYVFFH